MDECGFFSSTGPGFEECVEDEKQGLLDTLEVSPCSSSSLLVPKEEKPQLVRSSVIVGHSSPGTPSQGSQRPGLASTSPGAPSQGSQRPGLASTSPGGAGQGSSVGPRTPLGGAGLASPMGPRTSPASLLAGPSPALQVKIGNMKKFQVDYYADREGS